MEHNLSNLLPEDGIVEYYGQVFDSSLSENYFQALLEEVSWEHDVAIIFGKRIVTKRKVAWYGSQDFSYTYSKNTKKALPWTKTLEELLEIVQIKTGASFNSCLLNLYHNGQEGVSWHSDGEKELEKEGAIASLSFGAQRRFCFKHKKTKEKMEVSLENGSLLTMRGVTQEFWQHCLPTTKKVHAPRISLTFRTINNPT